MATAIKHAKKHGNILTPHASNRRVFLLTINRKKPYTPVVCLKESLWLLPGEKFCPAPWT